MPPCALCRRQQPEVIANASYQAALKSGSRFRWFDHPVSLEATWAALHVTAASVALLVGSGVLWLPKGGAVHRASGAGYVLALVVVDVAALLLHRADVFGVFHGLAVVSLSTLAVGLLPMLAGKTSRRTLNVHAYCMTWSYAGLVAAGVGQLAAVFAEDLSPLVVPAVIIATLGVSGAAIHTRVPLALRRLQVGRVDPQSAPTSASG